MAKNLPRKTADAVENNATTSKTTATEAAKADSAAKNGVGYPDGGLNGEITLD